MTRDDLKSYRADRARAGARHAIAATTSSSMPPSSSGGVMLIEMLNILEGYPSSPASTPARAAPDGRGDEAAPTPTAPPSSAIRRCVDAPLARLLSKRYAATLRATHRSRARAAGRRDSRRRRDAREGDNTTHFSVVDRFGNAVSNTYTLNFSYGVGLVADGTGVLLNNELDDFAAKPRRAQRLRPGRRRRPTRPGRASGRCRR